MTPPAAGQSHPEQENPAAHGAHAEKKEPAADGAHAEKKEPAADGAHAEKKKMTVSERSIGALAKALEDWLAGRSAGPDRPTVTGARTPDTNGLSSTSVLF